MFNDPGDERKLSVGEASAEIAAKSEFSLQIQ